MADKAAEVAERQRHLQIKRLADGLLDYTAGGIDIDLSDPANGIEGDQVGLGAGDHDRPQRRA